MQIEQQPGSDKFWTCLPIRQNYPQRIPFQVSGLGRGGGLTRVRVLTGFPLYSATDDVCLTIVPSRRVCLKLLQKTTSLESSLRWCFWATKLFRRIVHGKCLQILLFQSFHSPNESFFHPRQSQTSVLCSDKLARSLLQFIGLSVHWKRQAQFAIGIFDILLLLGT